jgi:hypothetical protein
MGKRAGAVRGQLPALLVHGPEGIIVALAEQPSQQPVAAALLPTRTILVGPRKRQ